uniref:Link domain-containing protein n=1 Tax=Oryzias latipes TaxID=8090 RepID=A0A3P9KEQ7_ORYLA
IIKLWWKITIWSITKVQLNAFLYTLCCGVFLLIEGGTYTLNFTAARDTCLSLNVTMATKAQMEWAIQHGLETCK